MELELLPKPCDCGGWWGAGGGAGSLEALASGKAFLLP